MSRTTSRSPLGRALAAAVVLAGVVATPALAQPQRGPRAAAPPGAEIAARAKAARLDRANATTGEFQGKRIVFTPAVLDADADLAAGAVIGVLENDVAGDETGLPAGRYNLYAAQLGDGWHVYAESDGQIVKEALRVKVERRPGPPADKRPRFRAVGWGFDMDYEREIIRTVPPVASVTVAPATLDVRIGESKQFTVELRDSTGALLTGRSVTWASSAAGVASAASGGVVTGVAPGTAKITATSGGKSGSATVNVPAIRYVVSVAGPSSLSAGQSGQASAYAYASSATCYGCPPVNVNEISWSSSNPAVATVYPSGGYGYSIGQVRGAAEGSAVITASYRGGSAFFPLTVTRALVGWVNVTPSPLTVAITQPGQLTATVYDATGKVVTDRPVAWSSADPAVADVTTAGRVLGISVGSTTVRATVEGVSRTTSVVVNPIPVATVTVAPAEVNVSAGTITQLEAVLRDAMNNLVTGRTVVWTTDNTGIADVTASGRVYAVGPGSATITATSEGKTGTAIVAIPGPTTGGPATTTLLTESISFSW